MYGYIMDFINECEFVAIEDYAYGAKGRVFDIAEFTGGLKLKIYESGKSLRIYSIGTIKMYADLKHKGNALKEHIQDAFLVEPNIPDLTFMPDAPKKSPRLDIHDAYFIAKLLNLELSLRSGIKLMWKLPPEIIKVFNRVTTANPVNILARDFLTK